MASTVYSLLNDSRPITNVSARMRDLDTAKRVAMEFSALDPEATIFLQADEGGGRGPQTVAVFVNVEEFDPEDFETMQEDVEPYLNPHFPED